MAGVWGWGLETGVEVLAGKQEVGEGSRRARRRQRFDTQRVKALAAREGASRMVVGSWGVAFSTAAFVRVVCHNTRRVGAGGVADGEQITIRATSCE